MKLSLRFRHVIPILALVITDGAFIELFGLSGDDYRVVYYVYLLVLLSLGLSVRYMRLFSPIMRNWLLVLLAGLCALALESYAGWGSWMVYPHVFSKLTTLLTIFGIYAYYRRYGMPPFGLLVGLTMVGLLTNLFLLHRDSLSMSAFLDNERGFGSTSTFMLPLLALYYLNQYLTRGGLIKLGLFFGLMGLIVFLQHRTVWIAVGVALLINGLLLLRTRDVRLSFSRLLPVVIMPVIVLMVGGLATVLENPAVLQKLEQSVDDIQHSDTQGTGSWRLQQFQSYVPYLEEYPILGMRLEGFELPVQFYSNDTNAPVWRNGTGHHFHSFYVDRLFYFGLVGVLMVVLVPIVVVGRRLRQRVPLDPITAALIAYGGASLIYGISYDWPPYVFAFVGLMLAAASPVAVPVLAARPVPAPPADAEPADRQPPRPALLRPTNPASHATA